MLSRNPFIRYRERLCAYRKAFARGWSDQQFVKLVETLSAAVAQIHGSAFYCTRLTTAPELAGALSLDRSSLWLKDETVNVGGSHKARHLFGVALHLAIDAKDDALAKGELAIASCGNAAIAAAIVARAAKRKLTVFLPTWAAPEVVQVLHCHGAKVVTCERRSEEHGDPAYLRCAEAVADGAVAFSCQSTMTPSALDGGRTLGFELADQLTEHNVHGVVHLYVQVGGGALASATWQGLTEGIAISKAPIEPVLHPVQTESCAPLIRAWQRIQALDCDRSHAIELARAHGGQFMSAWESVGMSSASGILDDVTYDWLPIIEALVQSDGWPVTVDEQDVVEAHRLVHTHTTIDADATGTSGLAGMLRDIRCRRVNREHQFVALITGVTR